MPERNHSQCQSGTSGRSNAHMILVGSHKKKTASGNRDYLVQTSKPVTRAQRKQLVENLQNAPGLAERYTSLRAKTNAISMKGTKGNIDIDIVSQNVAYTQRQKGFVPNKEVPTASLAAFHNFPAVNIEQKWACSACTFHNHNRTTCEICDAARPNLDPLKQADLPTLNKVEPKQNSDVAIDKWSCSACTFHNSNRKSCAICATPKPNIEDNMMFRNEVLYKENIAENGGGQQTEDISECHEQKCNEDDVSQGKSSKSISEQPDLEINEKKVSNPDVSNLKSSESISKQPKPEINEKKVSNPDVPNLKSSEPISGNEQPDIDDKEANPSLSDNLFSGAYSFLTNVAGEVQTVAKSITNDFYREFDVNQDGRITFDDVKTKAETVSADFRSVLTKENAIELAKETLSPPIALTTKIVKTVGQWQSLSGNLSKKDVNKIEKGLEEMKERDPEMLASMTHIDLIALATCYANDGYEKASSYAHQGYEKAKPMLSESCGVVGHASTKFMELSQPLVNQATVYAHDGLEKAKPVMDQARGYANEGYEKAKPMINDVEQAGTKMLDQAKGYATEGYDRAKPLFTAVRDSAQPAVETAVNQAGIQILSMGTNLQTTIQKMQSQPREIVTKKQIEAVFQTAIEFGEKSVSMVPAAGKKFVAALQSLKSQHKFDMELLTSKVDLLIEVMNSFLSSTWTPETQPEDRKQDISKGRHAKEQKKEKEQEQKEEKEQDDVPIPSPDSDDEMPALVPDEDEQDDDEKGAPLIDYVEATEFSSEMISEMVAKAEETDTAVVVDTENAQVSEKAEAAVADVGNVEEAKAENAVAEIGNELVVITIPDVEEVKAKERDDWEEVADWESSKWELIPPEYASQAAKLKEMGFDDVEKLVTLLRRNEGCVDATCASLLK